MEYFWEEEKKFYKLWHPKVYINLIVTPPPIVEITNINFDNTAID